MVAAFLRSSAASAKVSGSCGSGFLDEGEFGGGGGGGDDHPLAGVFPVESGEGGAAEFRLVDVGDDFRLAEAHRQGRAGLRRAHRRVLQARRREWGRRAVAGRGRRLWGG